MRTQVEAIVTNSTFKKNSLYTPPDTFPPECLSHALQNLYTDNISFLCVYLHVKMVFIFVPDDCLAR